MWPRTEDEMKSKTRNCGFVSFKNRKDASEAMVRGEEPLLLLTFSHLFRCTLVGTERLGSERPQDGRLLGKSGTSLF
jgi:hypothetical protein